MTRTSNLSNNIANLLVQNRVLPIPPPMRLSLQDNITRSKQNNKSKSK